MKYCSLLFLAASLVTLSQPVLAGYVFSPSVTYMDRTLADNANPEVDAKFSIVDLRLGYIFDMGLYVGGLYSLHDENLLSDSSDSYFGPSVGYFHSGFLIAGTYYLYGERDLTAGGIKYSKVKGFQIDLSYSIFISDNFAIGPQLTYHSIAFDEVQISGIAQATDYEFNGVTPYFNLSIFF